MGYNAQQRGKSKDGSSDTNSTFWCGSWFLTVIGALTVILVIAVVHVATSDEHKTYFDELLSTGGAIRSARKVQRSTREGVHDGICASAECKNISRYMNASMDHSKDPCVDFFDYVCGGWIKANPIPKSSSTYSTFTKLNGHVEKSLKALLEGKKHASGLLDLPKNFYHSCMDLAELKRRNDKPLKDLIKETGSWSVSRDEPLWREETWDLERTLMFIQRNYTSAGGPLFSVHISDDPVNNSRHIIEIDQAGPSLSRQVYFDSPKILNAYKTYIIDVGKLLGGGEEMKKTATEIIKFETQLAKISIPDADKIDTMFNRMTIGELEKDVPEFPWLRYVNVLFHPETIKQDEEIIVPVLSYLKKMVKVVKKTPKRILANYVVWNVIQDEVSFLSKPYRDTRTRYRETVLGSKGQKKRWKTCVMYTNELLGDILGSHYVTKHFSDSRKEWAKEMILEVRQAFKDNVDSIQWMDKFTKLAVMEKADGMNDEVGYPEYLVDKKKFKKRFAKYKGIKIGRKTLFQNRIAVLKMAHARMLKKLRKKVDKEEWPMDPQTINAMYSFNENEMIIPAGILQAPFFYSSDSPSSLSFGAIGSILGHEMTHGFDNTGRKFNKNGELTAQWWSKDSLGGFDANAKCIQNQYSKYKVRGKYPINGKLTLGENIADNGGFKASYRAYRNWIKEKGGGKLQLPGLNLTNQQLFFVAFGQAYCSNSRPTEQYLATLSDHHSEEKFRVIGTLSNSREFAQAFQCPDTKPMNPALKCSVWCDGKTII